MRELALVVLAVVGLALLGYGLQFLAQPAVYETAWLLMSLLGVVAVTVFSPDDLELVKGGPALRREWIDDALVSRDPRHDAQRSRSEEHKSELQSH